MILGLGGAVGSVAFMVGLGAWRTRDIVPTDPRLPLPVTAMDWSLTDHRGATVTPANWIGRPVMAFFGFTFCPDVCPTTLNDISDWLEALGTEVERLTVVLISVDPERDRRLGIDAFTQAFHPAILGLAGDEATTRAAADSFKIFYEREADAKAPDGYAMAHSPALYLIGPDGDWLRQFPFGTPAAEILADLKARL